MSKRDRQGVRTPAGLEQKYNFEKRFDETMDAAIQAAESVKALDENLSQTEIFNRLTNNGKAQGIHMDENGNIFMNASYLVTGVLASKDGSTFYLDLVNGILKGQFSEFSISGKSVDDIAGEAQQNAQDYADEAAKNAVNGQTQTDVFNKLTNNGAAKGIYYVDGELYINASYLASGILKSLNGTTFYLDLANNVLKGNFSELSIAGKKASWKENDDGTFTLVAT